MTKKKIGLALGGGGAKGLAHISVLTALEKLGVKPMVMSGTSIGSIIGALYASGLSADEVRSAVDDLLEMPSSINEARASKRIFGWLELLSLQLRRSHMFKVDGLIEELGELIGGANFEDLKIPLSVVAADFWQRSEVVLDQGALIPAIAASFCLPGVFQPIVIEDRVLVDGGLVNPVPFDLIRDQCDILIAVDVLGRRSSRGNQMPSYFEALFNSFQIAEKSISEAKRKLKPPDIYITPDIHDVKVLEFHKSESIYDQAQPECERLVNELSALL